MTNPRPRNIAASIHQRLLDKSKESARPFNELFQYYAIERFQIIGDGFTFPLNDGSFAGCLNGKWI